MVPAAGYLVLLLGFLIGLEAVTNSADIAALKALRLGFGSSGNSIPWDQGDPCDDQWDGIYCEGGSVLQIHLLQRRLQGTIAPEIGNISNLKVINLMWNQITGSIPSSIGSLKFLELLLLNGNQLSGPLPPELGNLVNMNRFQVDENNLTGPVPSTFGNLASVKHLHMNNNSFTGSIPPELGRLPRLLHLLLDSNKLTGSLPPELSNISTFQILQLDNNEFNSSIPPSYGSLKGLLKLSLRNSGLIGTLPDLSGLTSLEYLDLSRNQLSGAITELTLQNVTTIDFSYNQFAGAIPSSYARHQKLQALLLSNNRLNGTVSRNFLQVQNKPVLDFQNNLLSGLDFNANDASNDTKLWLFGNANICKDSGRFCSPQTFDSASLDVVDTVRDACNPGTCAPGTELFPGLEGDCRCSAPIQVDCRLKSPGFTLFASYQDDFEQYMDTGLDLSSGQVHVGEHTWEPGPRLRLHLKIFPKTPKDQFKAEEVLRIYQAFATWKITDNELFGPRELLNFTAPLGIDIWHSSGGKRTGISHGALAGILVAVIAVTASLVAVSIFKFARRRRPLSKKAIAAKASLAKVNLGNVKTFTLDEMLRATDGFTDAREVGRGGYGKVYRGLLGEKILVAIKRADENSHQGEREFLTEIELLSRIHHRNLVTLIGFCLDDNEQILVYEYMGGGNLSDRLSEKENPLDFKSRVYIALGAARGILYLHTEASPSIIHRDIKGTNILLTEKKLAKVSDFGLSRLAPDELIENASRHVSTAVKGTPGYLDPEYFLTRRLSDKSDVYSFGVVLLELITGKAAIYDQKNLVREVRYYYESGHALSMVDPRMGAYPSEALEPLLRLALNCSEDTGDRRPSMRAVVRELEHIWGTLMKNQSFDDEESERTPLSASASQRMNDYAYQESMIATPSTSRTDGFGATVQPRLLQSPSRVRRQHRIHRLQHYKQAEQTEKAIELEYLFRDPTSESEPLDIGPDDGMKSRSIPKSKLTSEAPTDAEAAADTNSCEDHRRELGSKATTQAYRSRRLGL